jgi:hypothetical protein
MQIGAGRRDDVRWEPRHSGAVRGGWRAGKDGDAALGRQAAPGPAQADEPAADRESAAQPG